MANQNNNNQSQGANTAPGNQSAQKPVNQASSAVPAGSVVGLRSSNTSPTGQAKEQGTLPSNLNQESRTERSNYQKPAEAPPRASVKVEQPTPPLVGEDTKHFLTRGRIVTAIALLLLVSFYIDKFPASAPQESSEEDDKNLALITSTLNGGNGGDAPKTVSVYFNNSLEPGGMDCASVFPTKREVADPSPKAAVAALIAGVSVREGDEGFFSSLSAGVPIVDVNIEGNTAVANFGGYLGYGVASGSCRDQAIRAQISQTLRQFTGVQNVRILVNGNAENLYGN